MSHRAVLKFVWASGVTGVMSLYSVLRQVPRADTELFHRHTRRWARLVTLGAGIEVRGFDTERIDPNGTYVFMANHQSHVDIPSVFLALPQVPGFLAKAELRKMPFFGKAMEVGGHVFVDRQRHDRAVEAIANAAREVTAGKSIMIFPEGTRSYRREIMPFKKGGFHLAKQARVRIVPIGIRGSGELLRKGSNELHAGVCEVHVGEPISVDTIDSLEIPELMQLVRSRISELADLPLAADRSGAH